MNQQEKGPVFPAPLNNIVDVLPIDMQDIHNFEKQISEIPNVTSMNAPTFMRDFLKAKDLASKHYSNAKFNFSKAKNEAKKAWSLAKLDRAKPELTKRGLKMTDANSDAYAEMDPEYMAAKERQDYFESLSEYMLSKMWMFQNAHADVQAIFRQTADPVGSIRSMG
jgi:anion-transporting  ArsA/GET3 family ATPase